MHDNPARAAGDLQTGDRLGPYRIDAVLGDGATGIVFRARHERIERTVALKVLRAELGDSDVFRKRFLREARVAAEVEHQNLVPIVEAGEAGGRYYLAAHYVEGRTLDERLAEGPFSLEELLRLVGEVGAGLDALHRRGLVHRDVKPSNVMLDAEGKALLTDFGLARAPRTRSSPSRDTCSARSTTSRPELIRGEGAQAASDMYALGCVAFACIAGQPPFASANIFEVTVAHLGESPPDPCAERPDLPPALSEAVLAALAKDPAERPRSCRAYALSLWLAGRP